MPSSENKIRGTITVLADGTGTTSPRHLHRIEHDSIEGPSTVGLWIDLDLGILGQQVGVELDRDELIAFCRGVENSGRLTVGEHVLIIGGPHGGTRCIVRQIIDENTVMVAHLDGVGVERISVRWIHRLFQREGSDGHRG